MRFWVASTVSDFGTYITTVALSVLVLVALDGTALDQGLVNAARWAPYLVFGLLAGIWVDRFRRRSVLIAADLGCGLVLAALAIFGALGMLNVPAVMALMFGFGTLALMSDAAYRSFLTHLVSRPLLVRANARLQQSMTVAQTTGGAVAGALVALVTAPFALLIDAFSYFFSAAVLVSLKSATDKPPLHSTGSLGRKIAEGLAWIYRHPRLRPLAWKSHIWFIGSAIMGAVFPALILNELRLGALGLGLTMGCAGVGAVLGTLISHWAGERWGTGRAVVGSDLFQPVAVALIALSPAAAAAAGSGTVSAAAYGSPAEWPVALWGAVTLAAGGQFLFGFAMGAESPLEMGYQQAVTPDRLMARMSATMRSANRGMIVIGAPLGGAIAAAAGVGTALWTAAAIMLVSGLVLLFSKFSSARVEDDQLTDEEATARG